MESEPFRGRRTKAERRRRRYRSLDAPLTGNTRRSLLMCSRERKKKLPPLFKVEGEDVKKRGRRLNVKPSIHEQNVPSEVRRLGKCCRRSAAAR